MKNLRTYITFLSSLLITVSLLSTCASHNIKIVISDPHTDEILFKDINRATELGNLEELRKSQVLPGDLEVRVWRGGSFSGLEGVAIKRSNDAWSGLHLRATNYTETQAVKVEKLTGPKSGWQQSWKNLSEKGILTIQQTADNECVTSILDGNLYVVEINQNNNYRYYYYPENGKCTEAKETNELGETIGLEFDTGTETCKTTEWFACMTKRHLNSVSNEPKTPKFR
ncbi:MAG: hypothetical protein ABI878_02735 [Acidobacteriota bacterium]